MRLVYDNSRFEFRVVVDSYCRLRIWRNGAASVPETRAVVLATDPDSEDAGTSITNAVEEWGAKVRALVAGVKLQNITFIEHYPHERDLSADETFDAVFFSESSAGIFHSPGWQRLERVWVEAAIGGKLD